MAGGFGFTPAASIFARMKRSIGVRHQAAFFTAGGSTWCSGWNDQNFRASGEMVFVVHEATAAGFNSFSGSS